MSNFKNQLNQYMYRQESQVNVDAALKQALYLKLAQSKPRSSWKVILPFGMVATLAVVAVLFSTADHSKNTSRVAALINNTLLPQQALAEAIENVMNMESLAQTFGLPNDGQLYHRNLRFTFNYPTISESNPPNGTKTIDLWTNGEDVRQDLAYEPTQPTTDLVDGSFTTSTLANVASDAYCIASQGQFLDCKTISAGEDRYRFSPLWPGKTDFAPPETEQLINDFTATEFADQSGYPGIRYEWSTSEPLHFATFSVYTFSAGMARSFGLGNERGKFQDGKYLYQVEVFDDVLQRAGDMYIQIEDFDSEDFPTAAVVNRSMVYKLNQTTLTLTPVTLSDFQEVVTASDVQRDILKGTYTEALKPVLYVLQNPEKFTNPTSTTTTTIDGKSVTLLRYPLTPHYLFQSGAYLADPTDPANQFFIDFYLDEAAKTFLGYAIEVNGNVVAEAWLVDEVLSAEQADSIFNVELWKQTFGPFTEIDL